VGYVINPGRPLELRLPSPLEELRDDRITGAGLRLFLKRDDLINPDIPGNKWRKLKYNLESAKKEGHQALITFGGAYSNHIRAVAAAGYYFGFTTVGVIRGEEHLPLNPSLDYAVRHGMRLAYLDRAAYREKMSPDVIAMLHRRFGDFYLLPEGAAMLMRCVAARRFPARSAAGSIWPAARAGPAAPWLAWRTGWTRGSGRWASRCSKAASSSLVRWLACSAGRSGRYRATGRSSMAFISVVSPGAARRSTSSSLTLKGATRFP
jgi:hypothetical protein